MMKKLISEINFTNHEKIKNLLKMTNKALLALLRVLAVILKKSGIKLLKTPELQLATVLVLGLLFSGLIIFGMGTDNQRIDIPNNTQIMAYENAADQNLAQE